MILQVLSVCCGFKYSRIGKWTLQYLNKKFLGKNYLRWKPTNCIVFNMNEQCIWNESSSICTHWMSKICDRILNPYSWRRYRLLNYLVFDILVFLLSSSSSSAFPYLYIYALCNWHLNNLHVLNINGMLNVNSRQFAL